MKQIMAWVSALVNFALPELLSPECVVPVTFMSRWSVAVAVPVSLMLVFLVMMRRAEEGSDARARHAKVLLLLLSVRYICPHHRAHMQRNACA